MLLIVPGVDITLDSAWASAGLLFLEAVSALGQDRSDIVGHRVLEDASETVMECKIEVIFIPIADVDKAIDFYVNKAGFTLDRMDRRAQRLFCVQVEVFPDADTVKFLMPAANSTIPGSSEADSRPACSDVSV